MLRASHAATHLAVQAFHSQQARLRVGAATLARTRRLWVDGAQAATQVGGTARSSRLQKQCGSPPLPTLHATAPAPAVHQPAACGRSAR